MKILFAAVLLGALPAQAQTKTSGELTVYVNHTMRLSPGVIKIAESTAQRLFTQIGVHVTWRNGVPFTAALAPEIVISVNIIGKAGPDTANRPLGAAWPFAGDRVEIYYDRIDEMENRPGYVPVILGYVLAHELAHNLQGLCVHAQTGIMKARWTAPDFIAMWMGRLAFEPSDISLIELGMKARQEPRYQAGMK